MKGGKGANLPDTDHVIRYVSWNRLRRDGDDNVLGFLPQAFDLRPGEPYLSVNWLEYQEGDRETQIRLSIWAMRCVRVVHEPEPANPGHSAIRQLQSDDLTLLEALAADAFVEKINNSDIPVAPSE